MADSRDYEEEAEIIYIPDDEGNEEAFEVIARFELEDGSDRKYMMVVPADEESGDDEEQEVFAFRYEEEGEEIKMFMIEQQDEWDMVEEAFNTLLAEFGDAEADRDGQAGG